MYVIVHGYLHTLTSKTPKVFYLYVHGRMPVGTMLFMLFKCDGCYYISKSDTALPDTHTNFGTFDMMFNPEYPIERHEVIGY